jgi:hypothetical protein
MLSRRFPRDVGVMLDADVNAETWLGRYVAAMGERKAFERLEEEAKNNLKATIGEASGITFKDGGRVTWKNTREVEKVDWRAAALALRERAEAAGIACADVMEAATTREPGARRFIYSPAKEAKS